MKIIFLLLLFLYQGVQIEKIQTLYIYQFAKQITWCQEQSNGAFIIGVYGESHLNIELFKLAQIKKIGERIIVVKKIDNITDVIGLNMLVITNDSKTLLNQAITSVGSNCILIVSLVEGHAKLGAALSLKQKEDKISFQINQGYFEKHNLKVSTHLVKLAEDVF